MNAVLNFVGDIALFRRYEEMGIDPIKSIDLPIADCHIGNFEFVVPQDKKKQFFDVQDKYTCHPIYVEGISLEKFSLLGLANNHALDYGVEGLKDTISLLEKKGSVCFGVCENGNFDVCRFSVNGIDFVILGVTKKGRWDKEKWGYGPNAYNKEELLAIIPRLSKEVDHVIIFPHWGTELVSLPDPNDVHNAREFIVAGASAVIGHHPHVPQGVEVFCKGDRKSVV
ncbi:CapA family protein, partial [Candidatus Roizmanbacteria bacterium]|nr:CapA family protein [Candidatus Roizmanbacteria bacterium]